MKEANEFCFPHLGQSRQSKQVSAMTEPNQRVQHSIQRARTKFRLGFLVFVYSDILMTLGMKISLYEFDELN